MNNELLTFVLTSGVVVALVSGLMGFFTARQGRMKEENVSKMQLEAKRPSEEATSASELAKAAMVLVNELQEELARVREQGAAMAARIAELESEVRRVTSNYSQLLVDHERQGKEMQAVVEANQAMTTELAKLEEELAKLEKEKADKQVRDEKGRFIKGE